MAIKVTGTTVINDSREVENIADVNRFIRTPEITSPTDGSTDRVVSTTIEGSEYTPLFTVDERLYREFQIDLDSGDFSSLERSAQINSDSYAIQPNLSPDTSYKARIRDISINGTVSEWSEIVSFDTVNVFVDEPTVSVPNLNEPLVSLNPAINTSSFSVTNDTDTHESTDWEVIRTSDDVVVFESFNDTSNLTSITVTPGLDSFTEYEFIARHRGATYGTSDYGSVVETTADTSLTTLGAAAGGGFYMGTISTAGTTYYLIVAPNSSGCVECVWKTTDTSTTGATSRIDGYGNTYDSLANSSHPAGNWTATRTISGFSDWYLPAVLEHEVFYDNNGSALSGNPLPAGETFDRECYWASTDSGTSTACYFCFDTGNGSDDGPQSNKAFIVRAVRRVPV